MQAREFIKLAKMHMPDLIDEVPFHFFRGNLIKPNTQPILQAINFQPSDWDKSDFYLNVFVQPLFVQEEDFVLSIGSRLGDFKQNGASSWNVSERDPREIFKEIEEDIRRYVLPWFKTTESPDKLLALMESGKSNIPRRDRHDKIFRDFQSYQTMSYCALLGGKTKTAISYIEKSIGEIKDSNYDLDKSLVKSCQQMRKLITEKPDVAKKQLLENVRQTTESIKLPKNLFNYE